MPPQFVDEYIFWLEITEGGYVGCTAEVNQQERTLDAHLNVSMEHTFPVHMIQRSKNLPHE